MNVSGLLAVVRGVRSYMTDHALSTEVEVGWVARDRQDNQGAGGANRIVFIPGEFDGAGGAPRVLKAGRIDRDAPQNHVGDNPRLRTNAFWHYPVTMSVWAVDPERPTSEEAQIYATEALLETALDALLHAVDPETGVGVGFANVEDFGEPGWVRPPGELAFGREIVVPFVLTVPLFTQPIGKAFPSPSVERAPRPTS